MFKSMHEVVPLVFSKVKSKQWRNKGAKYYLRTEGIDKGLKEQYVSKGHNTYRYVEMFNLKKKNIRKYTLNSDMVQDIQQNP